MKIHVHLHTCQGNCTSRAYPGYRSMKQLVYGLLLLIHDWSSPLARSPCPEAFPRVPLMVRWCLSGFGPLWFSLDPKREQNSGVQIRWGPNPLGSKSAGVQIRWGPNPLEVQICCATSTHLYRVSTCPGKPGKSCLFYFDIFQDWKVLKKHCRFWKVLEMWLTRAIKISEFTL